MSRGAIHELAMDRVTVGEAVEGSIQRKVVLGPGKWPIRRVGVSGCEPATLDIEKSLIVLPGPNQLTSVMCRGHGRAMSH